VLANISPADLFHARLWLEHMDELKIIHTTRKITRCAMHEDIADSGTVSGIYPSIIFDCPHCGKSLEIDARGAGYLVTCPDCQNEVRVPDGERSNFSQEDSARIEMEEMLRLLQEKVDKLQAKQDAAEQCFARLADEMALIQSALDRINEVIDTRNGTV
jgi:DNA-directed RNA polymerase subunit M/transcription elongation factor TFIIS